MKTHCKHGHELVPENCVFLKDGRRQCRLCKVKRCADWRQNNKARHNELRKEWASRNPASQANMRLKSVFGITLDEYSKRAKAQNHLCMICGEPEMGTRLSVDHDHATNEIRDLLCRKCNSGLGQFRDRIDLLLKAVEYLERWKK
jgi:hypothetical protein